MKKHHAFRVSRISRLCAILLLLLLLVSPTVSVLSAATATAAFFAGGNSHQRPLDRQGRLLYGRLVCEAQKFCDGRF